MRLSAELFKQIVDGLRSDNRSDRDKRLEPRVGMAGEVTLIYLDTEGKRKSTRARVRDVSRSGIGLYHRTKFGKDQRMVVQLQSANGDPIWLLCVPAHSNCVEKDRWVVGARIKQALHPDEVRRLIDQMGNSAPHMLLSASDRADAERIAKAILS